LKTFVNESVIEEFYKAIAKNDNEFLFSVYIPHSDVFYVREHLFQKTGNWYTLDYVEWAMLKEGMLDPKLCHHVDEKLSWEDYPHEKLANRRRA
jgi:hypothetical protein